MKKIFRNTWTVLSKKEKKNFILLLLLDTAINVIDILSLALLLWIIQFYIRPVPAAQLSYLPTWLADSHSIALISIFFIIFASKNLAAFFIARTWYRFIGQIAVRISQNNLSGYQHAAFEEFIQTDSSIHIRKISFQPFEFCQYILSGIQQILTQAFLVFAAIVGILLFNAKLFLILLALLLPPVIVLFYFIKNRLAGVKKEIRSSNERSFQHLLDALKGYVESNIYDRHDFFLHRYIRHRKKFSTALFESIGIQNMPPRIIEIFAVLGLFILVAISHGMGDANNSDLLLIGAFMAAAYKIIPGMVRIINTVGQIKAYEFSTSDLLRDNKNPGSGNDHPVRVHSLQLKKISFHYPEKPVLNKFCFTIEKGQFIGISGKSGSGKTTIFNILLGFLRPTDGEICINEQRIDTAAIKKFWPSIAYVRQQSFFIHDTLLRNITLEEEGYDSQKLQYALCIAGLNDLVNSSPEGLNMMITENGKNISGGQQQRVAIARALYKKADMILLDEPFNELDETSEILLLEHFRQLSKEGKLIIMITHNSKSLSYCSQTISLDE